MFITFLLIAPLVGCDRDESISAYQAPKDPPPVVAAALPGAAAPSSGAGGPHWAVPSGWRELPAKQMRFASFGVNDSNPPVELTVIPLGPESGAVGPNVNRWEKQLGLPQTPAEKLGDVVKHV